MSKPKGVRIGKPDDTVKAQPTAAGLEGRALYKSWKRAIVDERALAEARARLADQEEE